MTPARKLRAGDGEVERVGAREADGATVVERDERAFRRQRLPLALPVALLEGLAESDGGRFHRGTQLAFDRVPDVDGHHRDLLERRVVEDEATLAAVAGEADGHDSAGLDPCDDAFAERSVADVVAGRERRDVRAGSDRRCRRAVRPRRGREPLTFDALARQLVQEARRDVVGPSP